VRLQAGGDRGHIGVGRQAEVVRLADEGVRSDLPGRLVAAHQGKRRRSVMATHSRAQSSTVCFKSARLGTATTTARAPSAFNDPEGRQGLTRTARHDQPTARLSVFDEMGAGCLDRPLLVRLRRAGRRPDRLSPNRGAQPRPVVRCEINPRAQRQLRDGSEQV